MTLHAYIYRGISGWSIALWDGYDTQWYFGFETWSGALEALKGMW
jgi:hypothetical protein